MHLSSRRMSHDRGQDQGSVTDRGQDRGQARVTDRNQGRGQAAGAFFGWRLRSHRIYPVLLAVGLWLLLAVGLWLLPAAQAVAAEPAPRPLVVAFHALEGRPERQFMQEVIERWNSQHPEMTAVLAAPPTDETANPLRNLIKPALGEGPEVPVDLSTIPDLLDSFGANFAVYAWAGAILPLNESNRPLVANEVLQDFLPSVLLQGIYEADGLIYSLAPSDNGVGLWGAAVAAAEN